MKTLIETNNWILRIHLLFQRSQHYTLREVVGFRKTCCHLDVGFTIIGATLFKFVGYHLRAVSVTRYLRSPYLTWISRSASTVLFEVMSVTVIISIQCVITSISINHNLCSKDSAECKWRCDQFSEKTPNRSNGALRLFILTFLQEQHYLTSEFRFKFMFGQYTCNCAKDCIDLIPDHFVTLKTPLVL